MGYTIHTPPLFIVTSAIPINVLRSCIGRMEFSKLIFAGEVWQGVDQVSHDRRRHARSSCRGHHRGKDIRIQVEFLQKVLLIRFSQKSKFIQKIARQLESVWKRYNEKGLVFKYMDFVLFLRILISLSFWSTFKDLIRKLKSCSKQKFFEIRFALCKPKL